MKLLNHMILLFLMPTQTMAYLNPPETISLIPVSAFNDSCSTIKTYQASPAEKNALKKCQEDQLKPKEWILNLFEKPDKNSKKLGKLKIKISQLKKIEAIYITDKNISSSIEADGGNRVEDYGDTFVFTIQDKKGDWIQLPRHPFLSSVWINIKFDWGVNETPGTDKTQVGSIVTSIKLGDVVFTQFQDNKVTYRKENANDMNCEGKEVKIKAEELKEIIIKIDDLYDSNGHINFGVKYNGGC